MRFFGLNTLTLAFVLTLVTSNLQAHVPYLEPQDYSFADPFVVPYKIEQSIAVYSWLEFENGYTDDIDFYTFDLDGSTRVFVESLVPVLPEYEQFLPSFAVIGPGLPDPGPALPFTLPPGYGAYVLEDLKPGQQRPKFFEPFGNKWYYQGPTFDQVLSNPGTYYVVYWDPYSQGGDYVAVLGYEEIWRFWDIMRALIVTPLIRQGKELHV